MSSVTCFSLSGIFSYQDDEELLKFRTYLSQINNSPIYRFMIEDCLYRTVFSEKFELGTSEVHLCRNTYKTGDFQDFYKDIKCFVRFYERSPLAAKSDVNAKSMVESICEDDTVAQWIEGLGFKGWEMISKDGYAFRSPEGIETDRKSVV